MEEFGRQWLVQVLVEMKPDHQYKSFSHSLLSYIIATDPIVTQPDISAYLITHALC